MKKILTILAASAMFFAFGEDIDQGADFEAYTATGEESFKPNEDNDPDGSRYWYSASSVGNVISNHVGAASKANPVLPTGVERPDLFKDNINTNFLYLETEAPLFRTVKPTGKLAPDDGVNFNGCSITNNSIYLDTLVKFTAADSAFTSFEDGADKIAIEYVEHEEESHEENEQTIIDSKGYTNFVIRAGYLSSPLSQTNYFAAVPAGFKKDDWHRLTVRSFGSIDAAKHVGFVVYLDGEPLAAEAVDLGNGVVTPTVISPDPAYEASGAAAAFYETGSLCALFPSAVQGGDNQYEISAVAFSGNGSVDDVVFTTETPNFIKATELVRAEITLGTGVSNVTVTVESTSYGAAETNDTTLVFNLPAGTESFVLGVTADTANGYTFDETSGITLKDATYDDATDTVTITGDSPALTLKATRSSITYINDNDDEVPCVTLSDAFANVKDGGTIKLAYDFTVATDETTVGEQAIYDLDPGKEIVLDLNGNTLYGGSGEVELFYLASGKMTVIDSVGGGKIIYEGLSVFGTEAEIYVGATTGDNGVTIDGVLFTIQAEGQIVRGNFYKVDNSTDDDPPTFIFANSIENGSELKESLGDYWVVAPQGVIGTYTVTVTPTNNATYAVTGAASNVGDVYTVATGHSITITATPAGGYEYASVPTGWTAGQDGKITIEVSAEATVAIPAPTAVTYQVTVTPTANATYAAVYNEGGAAVEFVNDVAAVTVGKTITITATPASGYEYADTPTGWTAGQDGKITIEVSAEATVAIPAPTATSSYPSYITGHDDYKSKYDTWAGTYGADTGSAYEAAFLLNVAPGATDPELKPTAITISGSKVTITANQDLKSVNGKVYIKTAGTLAGLATAEYAEATVDDTTGAIEMTSNGTAAFFKIKVDF